MPDIEVKAAYNNINRAKFNRTRSQRHHHFSFKEGYVVGTYTHLIPRATELELGVGFMRTTYDFTHHPRKTSFHEHHFNNLLLNFGAATEAFEKWEWDAGVGLQINTEHFSLSRYTFVSGVLHGKHQYRDNCKLHVGIVGNTGMRYTRVLPVIGFDYKFSEKWMLNAVFPLDMSLEYTIDSNWSLDAAIRYILSRQRLNDHGHYPRGLVAYRNWGAEVGLNYKFKKYVDINLHIGDAFAGRMRISNRHDKHRKHLRLDSALYYGLQATVAF